MQNKILDVIYPRHCPVCHDIVKKKNWISFPKICEDCRRELSYVCEPKCKKCGKEAETEETEYCTDCKKHIHNYDTGVAVWNYRGKIKESVYQFKYANKREYADFYIEELLKYYREEILKWHADAIIPIPLHKIKQRKRGFNQAEVLGKKISRELEIPIKTKVLIRNRKTLPQKELSYIERRKNLKNAFKIGKNSVELKKVILIDDIYTTGSTIDEASKILKAAGVKKIYFICLCIGNGR